MDDDLFDSVSTDRIENHIQALQGVRHPTTAPQALEETALYIETYFASLGYTPENHLFNDNGREFRNIIASKTGGREPATRVLIIAHYDTVPNSPGADDNASGIAVLLEIPGILTSFDFDRTVQFAAVNLEEMQRLGAMDEMGLIGSRALALKAKEEDWDLESVIVLESIAFAGDDIPQMVPEGLPVKLPESGNFISIIGNEESKGLVQAFVQGVAKRQIPLQVIPLVVPGNGEALPDTRRSDHSPFWDQGFKAVMLTDTANFRNPHYHQPTDTLETLNLPFAAEVCRAVMRVVLNLGKIKS